MISERLDTVISRCVDRAVENDQTLSVNREARHLKECWPDENVSQKELMEVLVKRCAAKDILVLFEDSESGFKH